MGSERSQQSYGCAELPVIGKWSSPSRMFWTAAPGNFKHFDWFFRIVFFSMLPSHNDISCMIRRLGARNLSFPPQEFCDRKQLRCGGLYMFVTLCYCIMSSQGELHVSSHGEKVLCINGFGLPLVSVCNYLLFQEGSLL